MDDRKEAQRMKTIAIVYWSGTGNTEAMARLVAEGAEAAGGKASLIPAAEFGADRLASFDAFAFGCPSMGAEELEDTEFAPMFEAVKPGLSGRTAALFGSYGWGDGQWMRTWADDCRQAGIVLAAEPVIACEAPDEEAGAACRALGTVLAE